MSYRIDKRTLEEFKADIKESSKLEEKLLQRWLKTENLPIIYEFTGCGPDGEYLTEKDVTTRADFRVPNIGNVEVKFSKKELQTFFHLKVQQIDSYIKQKCLILMVNGANTQKATYTLLNNKYLKYIRNNCVIINWYGFGGKASYRCLIQDFTWRKLL